MNSNGNEHLKRFADTDIPEQRDDEAPFGDEGDYRAWSGRSNKPEMSIGFVKPGGLRFGRSYARLNEHDFDGRKIVLVFYGMHPIRVTIAGRNLKDVYRQIHHHRVAWLTEADRDMEQEKKGEPFVTSIEFEKIKEEE